MNRTQQLALISMVAIATSSGAPAMARAQTWNGAVTPQNAQISQSGRPSAPQQRAFAPQAQTRSFSAAAQPVQRSFAQAPNPVRQERNFAPAIQNQVRNERAFAPAATISNGRDRHFGFQTPVNRFAYNTAPSNAVVYNSVPVTTSIPTGFGYNPLAYTPVAYTSYANPVYTASYAPGGDQYDLDMQKNQLAQSIQAAMQSGTISPQEAQMLANEITQLNSMEMSDVSLNNGLTASDDASLVSYLNQIAAQFSQATV